MIEFTQKKCPTCGGRLELVTPQTGTFAGTPRGRQYECRCCHNTYELSENASLYEALQVASIFRESLNFTQAEMAYKNLLLQYKDDDLSDVYWNLFLCEQRVVFETDQNGEQFPSFYDVVPERIEDSQNYANALRYAWEYDRDKYGRFVALADKMGEAKNKYRIIKQTTQPYDIFICFKKSTSDNSGVTPDYKLAYELYNKLGREYNVFFSERSLDNIVVREYEPNIYHALYTSKIMLVLCSRREYLEAQWVKNEWSRFKAMSRTTAQAKSIIPIFIDDFTPEHLPEELRSCQGYAADIGLLENLSNTIKVILSSAPAGKSGFAGVKDAAKNLGSELMTALEEKFSERIDEMRKQLDDRKRAPRNKKPAEIVAKSKKIITIVTCVVVALVIAAIVLGVVLGRNVNSESGTGLGSESESVSVFIRPCKVSVAYGYDEFVAEWNTSMGQFETHLGLDYCSYSYSTRNVYAVANGIIKDVGHNNLDGYYIVIEHDDGFVSIYESLDGSYQSEIGIEEGDGVIQGQLIGKMSDSKGTEVHKGYHLHFEMRKDGKNIDPTIYLPTKD